MKFMRTALNFIFTAALVGSPSAGFSATTSAKQDPLAALIPEAKRKTKPEVKPSATAKPKAAVKVAVKVAVKPPAKPAAKASLAPKTLAARKPLTLDLSAEKPAIKKADPLIPVPAIKRALLPRPKQYVVLSFDGSRSVQMWSETRALAQELNIGLTIFMSGVHFLPETLLKKYYDPPGDKYGPGTSAIKKILDIQRETIPLRLAQIEDAVGEGVEVGSHAVGHFDAGKGPNGLNWSTTDWVSELSQFQNILLNVFSLNGLPERYPGEGRVWKQLVGESLRGFRAPLLSTNGTLAPALEKMGYRYDGSEAYPMEQGKWPFKKKDADVWEIPMAQIPIVGTAKKQVGMDYNFYAFDSKATPDLKNSAFYSQRWYDSLMNYYRHSYYGNRAPIHVGAHFDDYNGRAYFTGMFRFARAICHQPEVVCVTGSELIRKMQSLGPDRIAKLKKGEFEKLQAPSDIKHAEALDLRIAWANVKGKLKVSVNGSDANHMSADFKIRVYADGKLVGSDVGEVTLPNTSGIKQYEVKIYRNGSEILTSTRRAKLKLGQVEAIEIRDRETYLQQGDLPGAHGQPDASGILPAFIEKAGS